MTTDRKLDEPMTPFERELAAALTRYADRPGLVQPAAEIALRAREAPRSRRMWLVPSGIAAAVLIIAAAVAGIRALDGMASQAARATVDGVAYGISPQSGGPLTIPLAALRPAGEISDTNADSWFATRTVFSVGDIETDHLLVGLPSDEAADAFGRGFMLLIGPEYAETDLCPYYAPDDAPAICVQETPQREVP